MADIELKYDFFHYCTTGFSIEEKIEATIKALNSCRNAVLVFKEDGARCSTEEELRELLKKKGLL
ncbi:MAG: hypothetical protein LBL78_04585 [Prevotellaceae bacterium]|jgi:protein tyrosine phosphatase (PTP) superfamily phosphohydrolase (DUF442 family)|nr:hypothetical protein [Prevotellaceae bacterium]